MPVLKKQFLPSLLTDHPIFKGAGIGECVAGWKADQDTHAHSHVYPKDPFVGWICFRSLVQLSDPQMQRHELAHLLVSFHHGHDSAWRQAVLSLGGHLGEYEYRVGELHYHVPCHTRQCLIIDGRDPEEHFPEWAEKLEDVKYAAQLRAYPEMPMQRDRLMAYLDRCPISAVKGTGDGYIRQRLQGMSAHDNAAYVQLEQEVTVPVDVMIQP